jgi:serine/threonine-protein kinase
MQEAAVSLADAGSTSSPSNVTGDNLPPATLQDSTLQTVERQLATFIGPLAKILVKRAASKATNSDELYTMLAGSLERDADRRAFLSGKAKLPHEKAKVQPGVDSEQVSAQGAPLTAPSSLELTPEAIDQAARVLAPHVGPISAVLVRKAAKRADSLRSLYLLLAEHVEAGARRIRFLRDAGFPDA